MTKVGIVALRALALRALMMGICVVLLALLPGTLTAQAFPFYHHDDDSLSDPDHDEKWIMYPFYREEVTSNTLTRALHPLFSWYRENDTRKKDFDILWPIFSYRYRAQTQAAKNSRTIYTFPLFFQRNEERFGRDVYGRMVLPLWYEGRQGPRNHYRILFPIFWYGYNARLVLPFFPPREQTFIALFPLAGDFRGYWNRDRIRFFLWPIFVHSSEGSGADYNQIHSFIWPIFGVYSGPKVTGFRVWPLFSWVEKEGEFERYSFLWPLGHYRKGRISKTNDGQQNVFMFIPFFAKFRQPKASLDLIFPFYGKLRVGDRTSTGYALALYNTDVNTRLGIKEQRYLWFVVRKKTRLPGFDPDNIPKDTTIGGGVFPFYTRMHNSTRVRKSILWPIHQYRYNEYNEFTFRRSYVVPFYSNRLRVYKDGRSVQSKFFFPFFRYKKTTDGDSYTNALHLFFYSDVQAIDRLYAPLWSWWEKSENKSTGEKQLRWFREAWIYERMPDGSTRKRVNAFIYRYEKTTGADGQAEGHWSVLFGLFKRKL
ncbi:MAG TPA: hypothetical protein PKH51_02180 [Candidatus Sumerlaeota bacterium]|nr:hypothetical protein [Candidatus Sumerlaeota bacterium]HNM45800.1 hypothetical protein [Candidatus Sumerlaeota bacterium]